MKKILLCIVTLFLFLPLLQESFNLFDERPLKGSFATTDKQVFSMRSWAEAEYQINQEKYANENFGFRTYAVRIYNEYRYRFFNLSTNPEAVFGKDNTFFAEAYIKSYVGKDYPGHETFLKISKEAKRLQDTLAKLNITFIPILAPNKARAFPELIPDSYLPVKMSTYVDLTKCFNEEQVKYIDFQKAFNQKLKNSPYPLFSKYGIHWSVYGHTWAADSITKYISRARNIETQKLDWSNVESSDSLRGLDYDIGEAMNLLVKQLPSQKMGYPKYTFINKEKKKSSVLVIGDSFQFGLEETGIFSEVFSDYVFIYYNKELRSPFNSDKAALYKMDMLAEIKKHDVVIVICTEHNMDTFGWGFIEKANAMLNNELTPEQRDENLIKLKEFEIRENKDWMNQIYYKAKERGITVDEMITLDAKYVIEMGRKNNK